MNKIKLNITTEFCDGLVTRIAALEATKARIEKLWARDVEHLFELDTVNKAQAATIAELREALTRIVSMQGDNEARYGHGLVGIDELENARALLAKEAS